MTGKMRIDNWLKYVYLSLLIAFMLAVGIACGVPDVPNAELKEAADAGLKEATDAELQRAAEAAQKRVADAELKRVAEAKLIASCEVDGGGSEAVSANALSEGQAESLWLSIFECYPLSAGGKENALEFLEGGDRRIAEGILRNIYEVPRFDPVEIENINWSEDPYGEPYWQFVFYSLRPSRHLLNTWIATGDDQYRLKLLKIVGGFLDEGMDGPFSWDKHGTAWRTLVLVNTWWKLREGDGLPVDLGTRMLEALEVHGAFLVKEANYEGHSNHGVTQATALYLLAVNFPDLPGADLWLAVASERLNAGIGNLVDDDGVMVENSPFYHFYTLKLYWDISSYIKKHNLSEGRELGQVIEKMVSYATYILQPNLQVPTIGASVIDEIRYRGRYKEMADTDPNFLYVLTQGEKGVRPSKRNVQFPVGGQTIMRSGWSAGKDFANQTQIIFDVGSYRTNHSDFDALSFHLFSRGVALLPDSGLYTYEEGPWKSYFHGTSSHNTVVVDGLDQDTTWRAISNGTVVLDIPKKVFPGTFYENDEVVYQSAQHNLYVGVTHRRAIALIGDNLVLIIDNLISSSKHTYEQKFHLFSEAKLDINGLMVVATGDQPDQSITVQQLLQDETNLRVTKGQESPINGFCSEHYESAVPCYALSYVKNAETTSYVTLLQIGDPDAAVRANIDKDSKSVTVKTDGSEYRFPYDLSADFDLLSLDSDCGVDLATVLDGYPRAIRASEERSKGVSVLVYHGIDTTSRSSISLCTFKEQMFALKQAGYVRWTPSLRQPEG